MADTDSILLAFTQLHIDTHVHQFIYKKINK